MQVHFNEMLAGLLALGLLNNRIFNGIPKPLVHKSEASTQLVKILEGKGEPTDALFDSLMGVQDPGDVPLETAIDGNVEAILFIGWTLKNRPEWIKSRCDRIPPRILIQHAYFDADEEVQLPLPAEMPPIHQLISRKKEQSARIAPALKRFVDTYTLYRIEEAMRADDRYPPEVFFYLKAVTQSFSTNEIPADLPTGEKLKWCKYNLKKVIQQ